MRKIIFLDIDGVLNCEHAYKNGFCRHDGIYGHEFYPPSKELINKLIEETGAQVIISSTWRLSGLEEMQNLWKDRGMTGEMIGITCTSHTRYSNGDSDAHFRGLEIDNWLKRERFYDIFYSKEVQRDVCEKSNISNYIIIDDDSDMLYNQREHFVHVLPAPRNTMGFTQLHYRQAKKILSQPIYEQRF